MDDARKEELLAPLREALFLGQKIEAIKLYREHTGVGLAQAKAEVEKLEQELRLASPEKFTKAPPKQGCVSLVVLVAFVSVAVILVKSRP